jgi:hypothetical protein
LKRVCGTRYGGSGLWDDQKKLEKERTGLRMWFLCMVGVNTLSSGEDLVYFVTFDLVLNAAYIRIVFFRLRHVLKDSKWQRWNFLCRHKDEVEFKEKRRRMILAQWRTLMKAILSARFEVS